MNIALSFLFALTNLSFDALSTGYIHQIRADLALAERVVLKPSPENGGGTFTITDANDLRLLARTIDRKSEVFQFNAKAGTTNYVVVEIFVDANSKQPDLRITFLSKAALFTLKGKQHLFSTADGATFKALMKMVTKRKRD